MQLRQLEVDGIISRRVYPEVPARVEYALTPFGRTLSGVMERLHRWGETYQARQVNRRAPLASSPCG